MFTREQLEAMKKPEVNQVAKDLGVQRYNGKNILSKSEMIDNILNGQGGQVEEKVVEEKPVAETSKNEELTITINRQNKSKSKKKNKKSDKPQISEAERMANKLKYIENCKVGTLVAFKLPGQKVKSAMVIRRSSKNRKFKVETKYGAEFIVAFDQVIWVRTNKRWPKGVYRLLKGIEVDEG